MILKCIAVDDEVLALNKIKRFLAKINFIDLINTFDSATDALHFLKNYTVDLIFLDIKMPELTGFQLLNKLENKPCVILTTAFDQYALKSYDFDVVDYVLKPVQFDRLLKAVEKVYALIKKDKEIQMLSEGGQMEQEHMFVKSSGKIVKIRMDDILYIEGMKDYLAINLKEKRILTLTSFSKILKKLPGDKFMRVHKSYVVAVNKIEQLASDEVVIMNKHIPVSKTFKQQVQALREKLI